MGRKPANPGRLRSKVQRSSPQASEQDASPAEMEEQEEQEEVQEDGQDIGPASASVSDGFSDAWYKKTADRDLVPASETDDVDELEDSTEGVAKRPVPTPSPKLPSQGASSPRLSLPATGTRAISAPGGQAPIAPTAKRPSHLATKTAFSNAAKTKVQVTAAAPPSPSESAKKLFPVSVPKSIAEPLVLSQANSNQDDPKKTPWPPRAGMQKYKECNPPCIEGRGICNDNLCFCKSPYTGTTCQHKMGGLVRIAYPMVAALAVVSVVFGILLAQALHAIINLRSEGKLSALGDGYGRREVWMPPAPGAKNKARGHAVKESRKGHDSHPPEDKDHH